MARRQHQDMRFIDGGTSPESHAPLVLFFYLLSG